MKKIFYRTVISLILILFFSILYLSIFGIKTNKLNSQIISQIQNTVPDIELKINDVNIKLNLYTFTLNAKTIGTDLIYKNKIIKLENIKSKISLKSIIDNQFALSQISISTKSLPVKDLISFIRQINNNSKLFIVEQFIKSGFLIADLNLEFDKFGNVKNNYKINGIVNDGQISLLNKKLEKLNFIFEITKNEFKFNDIKILINNKNISVPNLIVLNKNKEFLVSGKLKAKDLNFKSGEIKDFIDNDFITEHFKEASVSLDSDFSFKSDQNLKFKNFDTKSEIFLNHLKINNSLKLVNYLPNVRDDIIFEKQKIKIESSKNKFNITGSGNILLQEKLDTIQYKIIKNKKEYIFDTSLEISKNPFIINLLNFEKNKKTTLNISLKGKSNKDELILSEILVLENENILSIQDLKLTNNYKINDIGKINANYVDKEKFSNNLKIVKKNKNYKITGNSFNINEIVTELLKSKNNIKQNVFEKKFDFLFDIKKIYLDKNNTAKNLKGFLKLDDNEVVELDLEAKFLNKKKIKLTIKKTDQGEKITTLFSKDAKPLVDRYKFIKGFSEGSLDFYSLKKNNETKSTLKIYDFKLKELPALTKILTLASLQGIADLLSGEGIRFNEFEMNFTNNDKLMTINEIYSIGPAISILMEGYIEKEKDKIISLRGTLVPATTINKTISSIPLIGDILVGKKTGEGVFGVSFKIKGPIKKLETTVNPIKTLTPRFITRTLEKIKKN
jgi:hypothetical protein